MTNQSEPQQYTFTHPFVHKKPYNIALSWNGFRFSASYTINIFPLIFNTTQTQTSISFIVNDDLIVDYASYSIIMIDSACPYLQHEQGCKNFCI